MTKSTKVVVMGMICILMVLSAMAEFAPGCVVLTVALMVVAPFQEKEPKKSNRNKYTPKI